MSDEYQSIPVAEARAAVQASGLLEAVEGPQYLSPQSPDWRPYFKPDGDAEHPDFGRVVITRQGQRPREVVIPWDEYAAELKLNDPQWHETRSQKPMAVFGAEVERHAYRVVFADVLAAAMAPRIIMGEAVPQSWAPRIDRLMVVPDAVPTRDWSAEVKAADAPKLNALYDEARDAGALVSVEGLQAEFTARLLELGGARVRQSPADMAKRKPEPRPQGNRRRGKRPERT